MPTIVTPSAPADDSCQEAYLKVDAPFPQLANPGPTKVAWCGDASLILSNIDVRWETLAEHLNSA